MVHVCRTILHRVIRVILIQSGEQLTRLAISLVCSHHYQIRRMKKEPF